MLQKNILLKPALSPKGLSKTLRLILSVAFYHPYSLCMKRIPLVLTAIVVCTVLAISCSKSSNSGTGTDNAAALVALNLPATPFNYASIAWPAHFTTNVLPGPAQTAATDNINTPATNPITDNGATLGRVLFYDKSLSANGTVSCSSCHSQANGFADTAKLSKGFLGGSTRRHSMGLANAILYRRGRFFWDERAATLEQQVLMPFQDATEMGLTLTQLVDKVKAAQHYPVLFNRAFGSTEITSDKISLALAQFVRSIVSYNSKYDVGRAQVANPLANFPNFTASENNGKQFFFLPSNAGGGNCSGCHTTEAFILPNPATTVNGLDATSTTDLGVFEAIAQPQFVGAFKSPSLRNIEKTAPYMHDGRLKTLEEVVEHYNSQVKAHPNLAPILKDPTGNPIRLNMTAQQKTDLVNFLKTLTDNSTLTDVKYSNPFK
jgi:cytochrome c peroxidase